MPNIHTIISTSRTFCQQPSNGTTFDFAGSNKLENKKS